MIFSVIPGFPRDLESWIDPVTRFLEPRYCRVFSYLYVCCDLGFDY